MQNYYVPSDKESGKGRYDLEIEPKDKTKAGYIIEIKHSKNKSKLEQLAKEALIQIKNNKYYINIKNRGITKIIALGIAFYKKEVFICHEEII